MQNNKRSLVLRDYPLISAHFVRSGRGLTFLNVVQEPHAWPLPPDGGFPTAAPRGDDPRASNRLSSPNGNPERLAKSRIVPPAKRGGYRGFAAEGAMASQL
jgi:hypothetical protein